MRPKQWDAFKRAAKRQAAAGIPLALIVDSPWIPGHLGISHLDYYLDPEVWFQGNRKIEEEFPDAILIPSWWMESGMAIEPSAMGARISFWPDQTPSVQATLFQLEDVEQLAPVDPASDGFMALALHRYRMQKQRIFDAGHVIPLVTARGPLCAAAFLHDVNSLMLEMAENPAGVHKLLTYATEGIIRWLTAQAEVLGPSVDGILLLDDIVGFLSREYYREFAYPYLKEICDAFPREWVKVYHNDASVSQFLEELPDVGFDVLNFGHKLDIAEAFRRTGGRLCLMGNVPPLEVGVRGTAEQVRTAALEVLRKSQGQPLILSFGGGVSPGTPGDNIRALVEANRDFQTLSTRSGMLAPV